MNKICTDINQSKKLIELGIDINTADMLWTYDFMVNDINGLNVISEQLKPEENDIPAWSLAALLAVLPNNENISTNLSKGGYRISTLEYTNSWFVDYEDETDGLNNCVTSADNPVDACYEMIIKLHKEGLL